jgi:hypothetical protein
MREPPDAGAFVDVPVGKVVLIPSKNDAETRARRADDGVPCLGEPLLDENLVFGAYCCWSAIQAGQPLRLEIAGNYFAPKRWRSASHGLGPAKMVPIPWARTDRDHRVSYYLQSGFAL